MKKFVLAFSALLLLAGCGESTQTTKRYVRQFKEPGSDFSKRVGDFHTRLVIAGTNSDITASDRSMLTDSSGTLGPPYRLYIVGNDYGRTGGKFTILETIMKIGDQDPITLISSQGPPVRIPFGKWLDHADSATHEIDLTDILPFQVGQEVIVTAKMLMPETGEEVSIKTVFKGVEKATKNSKLETMLQGS
ncbi:lipoprotein [Rubellicoccus peritrichatus]|uniref:Type IV secretion system putative lipoprotein virB7 n=1 Tax=Rubellicoccus peritrichatus TaxID=3080537 RepID=A0AAQ3LE36_9BACT|nr:lipoprotein [Puniceicoccus sp. CR14]WOO43692.1 hypothetical protein RZN69_11390 [Puniceicoccus sp. CR14]